MRTIRATVLALTLSSFFIFLACTPQAAPTPQSQPPLPAAAPAPMPAASAPAAPSKPAWQVQWDNTLEAAKKEGSAVILTSGGANIRAALMQVAQMQGIKGEVIGARSEESLAKVLVERRAGLYLDDINVGGYNSMIIFAKPAGAADPVDSAFILPDLTDPVVIKKTWYLGQLPWVDKDHVTLASTLSARTPIVINTELVKEGEIKSWRDVLDPKWKDKVILGDPTVVGSGQMGVAALESIMGSDYLRQLANIKPIVMRDQRQQMDWLSHGKVAIVVAPQPDAVIAFMKIGAPIKGIVPAEGTWVSAGSSCLSLFNKAPHPNAAKVFINGLLSKEGQTVFSRAVGFQSTRVDVATDHLRPEDIRQDGVKYFQGYTEDFVNATTRLQQPIKDLFGPLIAK